MSSDQQQVRELHSTWIDAVNAANLDCLLSLMTDDAVFLNPGRAPLDGAGFSANFSSAHRKVGIRCSSELEEVVIAGGVAYTRSRDTLSVTPRDGGAAMQLSGHRMTVYRRRAGHWLLARDAHTLTAVDK
jgi:uncharacterized protein (TIGR02246 family)